MSNDLIFTACAYYAISRVAFGFGLLYAVRGMDITDLWPFTMSFAALFIPFFGEIFATTLLLFLLVFPAGKR
jgi:hypothetical protein